MSAIIGILLGGTLYGAMFLFRGAGWHTVQMLNAPGWFLVVETWGLHIGDTNMALWSAAFIAVNGVGYGVAVFALWQAVRFARKYIDPSLRSG